MLKFDTYKEVTERINELTKEIHLLVIKGDNIDMSDTQSINNLFVERGNLLQDLQNFLESDEGKKIHETEKEFFDSFYQKLKINDEGNINLLKSKIKNLSDKLKDINLRKSLLIYQK